MRRFMLGAALIPLFCLAAFVLPVSAQWIQTNGPYVSQGAYALVSFPADSSGTGDLYGGAPDGVFRSTDDGATWTSANLGLRNSWTLSLLISDTTLFAGTNIFGVFRSTNHGATWTHTGPVVGVSALALSGQNLFAGTSNGIYRSTDDGTNWTLADSGMTQVGVASLAVSGTDIFAGSSGNVYRSTNNGTSWTTVDSGLIFGYMNPVYALAVSGTNLFAGYSQGLFRSTDNGTSWTKSDSGMTNTYVLSLKVVGSDIFAGTWGGGIFRSGDGGTTWADVSSGLIDKTVVSFVATGGALFAGTGTGVSRSTDNGATWTQAVSRTFYPNIFALASPNGNVTAGSDLDSYVSSDNGYSWPVAAWTSTLSMVCSGTDLFAGTYEGGVLRSTNRGLSWAPANAGMANTSIYSLAAPDTDLLAGTSGGGVFFSSDNGVNWNSINIGATGRSVDALAASAGVQFAGTDGDGVFRSTDTGASWAQVNAGLMNPVVHALALSGPYLFAGTDSGVFRSTNNGSTWTRADSGLTSLRVTCFTLFRTNLFAGTDPGGVFVSTDNGTSWTGVDSELAYPYVSSLTVSGATLFAGLRDGGIWRRPLSEMLHAEHYAVRFAAGWNMISVPALVVDFSQSALFPSASSNCFAYAHGYMRSDTLRDGLGYWIKINDTLTTSLTGFPITDDSVPLSAGWNIIGSISAPLAVGNISSTPGGVTTSQFYGYGGSYSVADSIMPGKAYWVKVNKDCMLHLLSASAAPNEAARITIVPTREAPPPSPDGGEAGHEAPRTYALAQNYPNPFNPSTEITFDLPERSQVSIRVFNTLGQVVGTLVDEEREAGSYAVRWEAEKYPSGVYMYQLRAGSFTESRKMLLIR